jgi:hypothetical protein|eukprot:COSAG01_NODE_6732_length_3524_cov_2.233285_3_plen_62_part_00
MCLLRGYGWPDVPTLGPRLLLSLCVCVCVCGPFSPYVVCLCRPPASRGPQRHLSQSFWTGR